MMDVIKELGFFLYYYKYYIDFVYKIVLGFNVK